MAYSHISHINRIDTKNTKNQNNTKRYNMATLFSFFATMPHKSRIINVLKNIFKKKFIPNILYYKFIEKNFF